jgi:hypothetical protein
MNNLTAGVNGISLASPRPGITGALERVNSHESSLVGRRVRVAGVSPASVQGIDK